MSLPNRIIWDFNGTILDDVQVGIDSANELLRRYNLPTMKDKDSYYKVFGFPIIDYYRRLGFDFDKLDYTVLAHEWVEIYNRLVKDAPVRSGLIETVKALKDLGIKQTVMSMTEEKMLIRQLDELKIKDLFDEVYGLNDIYANSKLALAEGWRASHPDEEVIFVGDTLHDSESAMVIGCKCYLLSGGHQSDDVLYQSNNEIISSPDELLKIIKK